MPAMIMSWFVSLITCLPRVLAKVSCTPFEECARATLPFLVPLVGVLLLLVFFPDIALWLPGRLLGD